MNFALTALKAEQEEEENQGEEEEEGEEGETSSEKEVEAKPAGEEGWLDSVFHCILLLAVLYNHLLSHILQSYYLVACSPR